MSASSLLANLWQRGVVLKLNDDRSKIVTPRRKLSPEVRARLAEDQQEILKLLTFVEEYQALIRNAFAIMLHHASSEQGLRQLAEDQSRLTDELGPRLTSIIRDDEARLWRRETGLCPVCGDEEECDMCMETDSRGTSSGTSTAD
jgi:hypothetical protein